MTDTKDKNDSRPDAADERGDLMPATLPPATIRFSRVLRPYRSSSERAIKIVSMFVVFLFMPTGTVFLLLGAWPVFGFMGLEVAALIFALRYNYRVGSAFETVTLTEDEFRYSKVDHWGKRQHWSFQPHWLRVRVDGTSKQLICGTHGRHVCIGKFLSDDERADLCAQLSDEVRRLRAAVPAP